MKTFLSACFAVTLLLTSTPALAQGTDNARCATTAGRERERCEFTLSRSERLRYRVKARQTYRANTIRQQRGVSKMRMPTGNVRRTRTFDPQRLKTHNRDGGNARRQITLRSEAARNACKNLSGTEKFQCVRSNWRALSKGNTR